MFQYSYSDMVFIAVVWTLSACGFMINSFLLFIIVSKSPGNLSPYRIFLANTAISQLMADVVYVFISPRVLSGGLQIIVIYLGPSRFLGKDVCRMSYTAMCEFKRKCYDYRSEWNFSVHFTLNAFLSWMISMVYRCVVLHVSVIKTRTVILMCLTAYMIPVSMMVRLSSTF
ncbi:hypothetical protein COOONC_06401 [Cooperia oncophora]